MAKEDLKKLRSKDPAERKDGIRRVAKSLDRAALHQLAVMAGDDPDPEIKKLAQQAGVYIRQKLGDIQPTELQSTSKPPTHNRIPVDNANAQKAQQLMQYASSQSENGDKTKAMKALVKAVTLDPNLRSESFYISLSEQLTGLEGDAAIKALRDESRIEQTVKKEAVIKLDKEQKAHEQEISTATGRDVLFDSLVFLGIAVIGAAVLLFFATYMAGQYQTSLEENRTLLAIAFSEPNTPRIRWIDGSLGASDYNFIPASVSYIYEATPQSSPKIEIMKPSAEFEATTLTYWSELGIGRVLGRGIGIGGIALLASLILVGVVHLFAGTFFGGTGRFAYTAHRLLSLFTSRTVLLLIIGFAGTYIYINSGGENNIATIFLVILGIFAFFTFLTGATTLKKAYRFNILSALLVMIVGVVVAVVLGGVGGFLLITLI